MLARYLGKGQIVKFESEFTQLLRYTQAYPRLSNLVHSWHSPGKEYCPQEMLGWTCRFVSAMFSEKNLMKCTCRLHPRLRDPVLEQQNSLGAKHSSIDRHWCTGRMLTLSGAYFTEMALAEIGPLGMIVVQSQYVAGFEVSQYSINKQGVEPFVRFDIVNDTIRGSAHHCLTFSRSRLGTSKMCSSPRYAGKSNSFARNCWSQWLTESC